MSQRTAKKSRKVHRVLPFRKLEPSEIAAHKATCLEAFLSPQFLAAIYRDPAGGHLRITVNRIGGNGRGDWADNITWDELQEVKRLIGRGDEWAVEVFPPDSEVINVANMRHLWLLPMRPNFGWSQREPIE